MNRRYSRPCEAPGREHRLGPINVKSVFLDERLRRLRLIDPALARSERRVGGTKRTPIARPALVLPRALSAQNNVPGSVPDRRERDTLRYFEGGRGRTKCRVAAHAAML
jgi:hypothetical protein